MSDQSAVLVSLQQQSEKHEKEIVTDLGTDRVLNFIGLYGLTGLAVLCQLASSLSGSNLLCYPEDENTTSDGAFLTFASSHCWSNTSLLSTSNEELTAKLITQNTLALWLPLFMFFQALLFCVPNFYWHFNVTGRLLGHLKFMNVLLKNIYDKVKILRQGRYELEPYDKTGEIINATYKVNEPSGIKQRKRKDELNDVKVNPDNNKTVDEKRKLVKGDDAPKDKHPTDKTAPPREDVGWLDCLLYGKVLTDRHVFSLFCDENFSNMDYYAYILSVKKLTKLIGVNTKDEKKFYPMLQAMLKLWMNKENLTSRTMAKRYTIKHIGGMLLAILFIVVYVLYFLYLWDAIHINSVQCTIPNYGTLVCDFKNSHQVLLFIVLNMFILVVHLGFSVYHLRFLRNCDGLPCCDFFKDFRESSDIALFAAYEQERLERELNQATSEQENKSTTPSTNKATSEQGNKSTTSPTSQAASEQDNKATTSPTNQATSEQINNRIN